MIPGIRLGAFRWRTITVEVWHLAHDDDHGATLWLVIDEEPAATIHWRGYLPETSAVLHPSMTGPLPIVPGSTAGHAAIAEALQVYRSAIATAKLRHPSGRARGVAQVPAQRVPKVCGHG